MHIYICMYVCTYKQVSPLCRPDMPIFAKCSSAGLPSVGFASDPFPGAGLVAKPDEPSTRTCLGLSMHRCHSQATTFTTTFYKSALRQGELAQVWTLAALSSAAVLAEHQRLAEVGQTEADFREDFRMFLKFCEVCQESLLAGLPRAGLSDHVAHRSDGPFVVPKR